MIALALALSIVAADKSDDRVLIYVDDVQPADKSTASDATALTTALCAALGKDKRVDVLCAPDVKQILNFAATAAMVGTSGRTGGAIQDRLDRTKHVVSSTFKKDGATYIFVVKAGPKAADAQAAAPYSDKPVIALEERADSQRKILDKLPALASQVTAKLLPSSTPPPPAPAPVDTPKRPASGW